VADGDYLTNSGTATITVLGEGPATVSQSATGNTPNTDQEITITLSGESTSDDGTADLDALINFGAVVQEQLNIFYIVDVSGSTQNQFQGDPVGDVNGGGTPNTILDAELAALLNLTTEIRSQGFDPATTTISIIPFSSNASTDPNAPFVEGSNFPPAAQSYALDDAGIESYLTGLVPFAWTNYEAPLNAVIDLIGVPDPNYNPQGHLPSHLPANDLPTGTNLLYFLSDGDPVVGNASVRAQVQEIPGQNPEDAYQDEAQFLSDIGVQMSAIGVGANVDLTFLEDIDNTDGAEQVTTSQGLSAALLGSPIPEGTVVEAQIRIYDDSIAFGTLTNTINIDVPGGVDDPANPNLVETPLGLELDLTAVTGFADDLGDANRAVLEVGLDDDEDGIVDLLLAVEVDIFGIV
jgi:hypothetical protein